MKYQKENHELNVLGKRLGKHQELTSGKRNKCFLDPILDHEKQDAVQPKQLTTRDPKVNISPLMLPSSLPLLHLQAVQTEDRASGGEEGGEEVRERREEKLLMKSNIWRKT